MKVLICLLIAVHLVVASEFCDYTEVKDVDFKERMGLWYNYARVNQRPNDVHAKCLNYNGKYENGEFKYSRYYVDDRTEEEHEVDIVMELDAEKNSAFIVSGDRKLQIKLLCLTNDFEVGQSGNPEDRYIYVYTRVMHPSAEVVSKIHKYLRTIDVDPHKLILVDQANCPRCTCENKHEAGHTHVHGEHHHHHHDHADHSHHHH